MKLITALSALLGAALTSVCTAQVDVAAQDAAPEATFARLEEGRPAPEIFIQEWLAGSPVSALARGQVYVVEFWASWCSACRRAAPVLTRAQSRYDGRVTVIAVASADGQEETLPAAKRFVHSLGTGVGFSVGFDDRRRTVRGWMDDAEQNLIPTAFVVDRSGTIAWIGNPLWPPGEFEDVLGQVVTGTFGAPERAATHRRWLEHREKVGALETQVDQADNEGRHAEALRTLDSLITLNAAGAGSYGLRKFLIMLHSGKDPSGAFKFGRLAVEGPLKDDAESLDELASIILDEEGVARRDLELAHRAAARAVELTQRRDPALLDTLARACRERGDLDKAVEFQTLAVEASGGAQENFQYSQVLDEYREQRARKKDR